MAIKVNGTTVIDDSRNISNIAGGFKTINSTSILGSGNISAGASTSLNAVGTYALLMGDNTVSVPQQAGSTQSGSQLKYADVQGYNSTSSYPSGTWRRMGHHQTYYVPTVFVRIS